MEMFGKMIAVQLKLMRFAIIPGILGGIACFIGPAHYVLIKAMIGVLVGLAVQHRFMLSAIKDILKNNEDLFKDFFEEDD